MFYQTVKDAASVMVVTFYYLIYVIIQKSINISIYLFKKIRFIRISI